VRQVEGCVREAMSEVQDGIRGIESMLENLDKDKRNLDSKIDKRKADLGRKEKQLSNLEVRRSRWVSLGSFEALLR
jgi:chromosome segregation ATPase